MIFRPSHSPRRFQSGFHPSPLSCPQFVSGTTRKHRGRLRHCLAAPPRPFQAILIAALSSESGV